LAAAQVPTRQLKPLQTHPWFLEDSAFVKMTASRFFSGCSTTVCTRHRKEEEVVKKRKAIQARFNFGFGAFRVYY
jgi:hypothetical protein